MQRWEVEERGEEEKVADKWGQSWECADGKGALRKGAEGRVGEGRGMSKSKSIIIN